MSDLRIELIQGQLNDIEENVRSIKATWGNTIMTLDNIKTSLKGDSQKAIDEAYQKGFEAGQHEATTLEYQQGLDDAWECMKAIAFLNKPRDMRDFFGCSTLGGVLIDYTASEAIEKLKAYEESQKADEIKVGDEVTAVCGNAVVVRKYTGGDGVECCEYWYYENARIDHDATSNLRKTGRYFPQMAELLRAMKEGAE